MSFKAKTDKIEENILSKINVHEYISKRVLHTDRFIKITKTNHPDNFEDFIKIYTQELKTSYLPANLPQLSKNIAVTFGEGSYLKQNSDLMVEFKNSILSNLQYKKYEDENKNPKKLEISFYDEYRGAFIPEYLLAVALCKVVPRPLALNTIREYTRGYYDAPNFKSEKQETLEVHGKYLVKNSDKTHKSLLQLDGGRLYFKVQRCLYADVVEDLPDKELVYNLECYGDYFNHQGHNEFFVLTRSKTCMKGDDYCDFCYHDKRFDEEINHPPEQFWEELEKEFN